MLKNQGYMDIKMRSYRFALQALKQCAQKKCGHAGILATTSVMNMLQNPVETSKSAFVTSMLPFGCANFSSEAEEDDYPILYPPSSVFVGKPAPDFSTNAVVDGEIKKVSLSDYKGKYVVLFFYPKDFTFVCPTEIIAFSDRAKEFEALNCQVIATSTDTEECHLAWTRTPRSRGGLGFMQIPILADVTKEISARYGVLIESLGIAHRGLFIINPQGVIQQITVNDLPIGRSVDETLRLLQAIQFVAEHGEVCPANWKPGEKTMVADPEKSMEYFSTVKDMGDDVIASKLHPVKDKQEFDQLINSSSPVVVDFYAPWCGKCRQLGPFLDDLVTKYPGVKFVKVDTTQANLEALSQEFGSKGIPAFKFYKGGKEVAETIIGYKKKLLEETVGKL
ncbi:hypothetical protein CEUSTIGMA_g4006.t1 [Chlamydomonas eustigma]|uniref:thioredoxin-dependent peroxiredoxin n=1 Tax=Chlamydomonas eustigma TaxID=1157962 RepID=A0A250X1E8_9CHLO|nr:hypothetical protein CEUSTIGMA_g4006.t1 [Chlamydomonas eustigma]|eukprot:GAX76560.1 hypothetical protein CEUSTIGMA_g4006.t1 [Chlamydomonas eustigma]